MFVPWTGDPDRTIQWIIPAPRRAAFHPSKCADPPFTDECYGLAWSARRWRLYWSIACDVRGSVPGIAVVRGQPQGGLE